VIVYSNGCATSEDMLWKLGALQTFVFDLHWPDEVFGEHISQRLRTLSTEMIEAAANRFDCSSLDTAFVCSLTPLWRVCVWFWCRLQMFGVSISDTELRALPSDRSGQRYFL